MRRLSVAAVALLLNCGAAAAQTMSTTPAAPAMGVVSPLGIPGASGATGSFGIGGSTGMSGSSAGIGLGATEIDPGGVSPAVSPTCNSGASSYGMTGSSSYGMASSSSSSFDGGGLSGVGSAGMTSGCASTAVGSAATGTAMPPSSAGPSALSGTIPLGSTELNNAGVSPLIGVAPPTGSIGGSIGSTLPGTPSMSSTGTLSGY